MLFHIALFNLASDKTIDKLIEFDRGTVAACTAYFIPLRRRYLGLFAVERSERFRYAEISVIDVPTIEDAHATQQQAQPAPSEILRIFEQRDQYMIEATELWLELVTPSPNVMRSFNLDHSVLRLALNRLAADRTLAVFAEFDRQTTTHYSEYMREIDWFYTGLYRAAGLPEFDCAEFDIVQAKSVEDALARDDAHRTPPDLLDIYAECRAFTRPAPERATWWFRPLSPSSVHLQFEVDDQVIYQRNQP